MPSPLLSETSLVILSKGDPEVFPLGTHRLSHPYCRQEQPLSLKSESRDCLS